MSFWKKVGEEALKVTIGQVVGPAVKFGVGLFGYGLKMVFEGSETNRSGNGSQARVGGNQAKSLTILPPEISNPQERRRLLAEVVEQMKANPLPENTPRLTRQALHDRR